MRTVLFIFFIASLRTFAFCEDPVHDLIKRAGDEKDYPGHNQLYIFDSTCVDVQETGLSYMNIHRLIKPLTAEGAKNLATVTFDYDPMTAYIEIRKVLIYRKDGAVEELTEDRFRDYPAPARMIYWGGRQKMAAIGRLEPGDAVEIYLFRKGFTYALLGTDEDERYIPPMRGHFYDIVEFWNEHPVKEKVYKVTLPDTKSANYRIFNGELNTLTERSGGKAAYIFKRKEFMPVEREHGSVALSDIAPKLLFSTSPDWESKSRWFYGVNENFGSFTSTPEIDEKVAEILEGAKDEMDSVSRLTHWVADEIRYSGISMGDGEGYTLHKGGMTFTDRCGVCKDKAGMLITMLRAAGFESYAAMTMAGSRIDDIPADQFNHCITIAKLSDGQYHLLDPTWVPFVRELWSSAEQQQNYLMGLPEGADLMITPLSAPENHYFRINATSQLSGDGTLTGEFTLTAEGQTDAVLRRPFTRHYKAEWYRLVEEELLHSAPAMKIEDMDFGDPYDYYAPVAIHVRFSIPGYALVTSDEIIFKPLTACHLFGSSNAHLSYNTDSEEKKYPFRDRCSKLVELNETIHLPDFKDAAYLPDSVKSSGSGADCEGGYLLNGTTLSFSFRSALKKRVYDPADWPSFREAVIAQNKYNEEYIILKTR
ncbi:MAG: DUF3857 and transglutaminase domain-containing protein [Bacteroidetes bacterium]|nr:DUF3857 and transglutaminase domain-containing protein [Bacteroidota bacterium]